MVGTDAATIGTVVAAAVAVAALIALALTLTRVRAARAALAGEREQLTAARTEAAGDRERAQAGEASAAAADERARTAEDRARTAENRARTAAERARTADERARKADDRAATAEDKARTAERKARNADDRARTAEERAGRAEVKTLVAENRARAAEERAGPAPDRGRGAGPAPAWAASLWDLEAWRRQRAWQAVAGPVGTELPTPDEGAVPGLVSALAIELDIIREEVGTPGQVVLDEPAGGTVGPDLGRAPALAGLLATAELLHVWARSCEQLDVHVIPSREGATVTVLGEGWGLSAQPGDDVSGLVRSAEQAGIRVGLEPPQGGSVRARLDLVNASETADAGGTRTPGDR